MEIITVTEEISAPFLTLVPDYVMEGKIWFIGCVDGEEIISVAVVGVDEPELELRWLYTDEPQRNRGGAKMILEHLKKICDKHNFSLNFVFDNNNDDTPVFYRLCEPLMFDIRGIKASMYSVTRSMILNSSFYKKYAFKRITGLKRLENVKPELIEAIIKSGEIDAYEIARANPKYSFVLEKEKEIVAVILAEDDNTIPDLFLSYFYIKKSYETMGIQFLRNVMEEVFAGPISVDLVSFQCVTEQMNKMVEKIVGVEPISVSYINKVEYDAIVTE